jgi:central glycolytic genes regulator
MIRQLVQIQERIVPDLIEEMQTRYDILHYVRLMQPIGRRTLATSLGLTERVLRLEVDFLKQQDLLEVATQGMSLTDEGRNVLRSTHSIMGELAGISDKEKDLKDRLGVRDVVIVPGDSDETFWVQRDMGRATVARFKRELSSDHHNTIAVTGGTTIASVAAMMSPDKENRPMTFVPARIPGGLGETLKLQANTVCSRMA